MSLSKTLVTSKAALGVCLALGTLSSGYASAADLNVTATQPVVTNQIGKFNDDKKPSLGKSTKSTYIVRLNAPAVAAYDGSITGLSATSLKATGRTRLDTKQPEVQQYRAYLAKQQASVKNASAQILGRPINVKYEYSHVLNGLAMELSANEADIMKRMPNVMSVEKEIVEKLNTDVGPKWIGAKKFWNAEINGFTGSKGENLVIAVLDSGINHDHPAFADVGGDGYDHTNPLGSGNFIPGSYCDTVDATFCNDKLIGAWDMVNSPEDPTAPEDSDGHGSHTASTAAGNVVKAATLRGPTTELSRDISGVAPHANIIAYDVCIDSCPGAALLAAVEQVVVDSAALPNGIAALNYSISGGDDPYNNAVELAFLNATAAGIYVAASAGNDGPGAGTSDHASPWVSTTAALTHNRAVVNSVEGLTSDGAPLDSIEGKGFTAPYGPAPIVYAGDFPTADGSSNDTDPAQCLEPFPAGHFNGEIVICDRGTIARVAKGANVLAGGAGGMVLANTAAEGVSLSGDAHFLPAVHVTSDSGAVLKDWVANNANTMASLSGQTLIIDKERADIAASFTSRGPVFNVDVIKPDIGGPGVDIIAAVNSPEGSTEDEYGFLSGTSMSSPHNAGAGALVAGATGWNPYQVKSAMMMTSNKKILKEDGVTAADPFDTGSGRINLKKVLKAGLVLDETPENFLAADPALGGDPKTLNIASMQNNNCVQGCSWTRTVTNVTGERNSWSLKAKSKADGINLSVSPYVIRLDAGESAEITVTAETSFAADDWNFGELVLTPRDKDFVKLHMPIAMFASKSSSPFLDYAATPNEASKKDVQTYTITVGNGPVSGEIAVTSELPDELEVVEGSLTETVTNGATNASFAFDGKQFSWSGTLAQSGLSLTPSASSPAGYLPMAALGIAPVSCPSDCDDGALIFDVSPFTFNGNTYSSAIISVNGTVELGEDSGLAISATNAELPNTAAPNNILAPLWTDLNATAGGNLYVATVGDGVTDWNVFEWENVPRFGTDPSDPANTHSFQVWIQADDSENIWFTYGAQGDLTGVNATVGLENDTGTTGSTVYFNGTGTAPVAGSELQVGTIAGGSAVLTFDAEVEKCKRRNGIVSRVDMTTESGTQSAIATTTCVKK